MKNKVRSCLLLAMFGLSSVANAEFVDYNTWIQEGSSSGGDWSVAEDGNSVIQMINGEPTYLVSQESFVNTQFSGVFGVETTSDDDWMGLVFGFTGLDDFYLFDWKQTAQGSSKEGFRLMKVNAALTNNWNETPDGAELLASSFSTDFGWQDN